MQHGSLLKERPVALWADGMTDRPAQALRFDSFSLSHGPLSLLGSQLHLPPTGVCSLCCSAPCGTRCRCIPPRLGKMALINLAVPVTAFLIFLVQPGLCSWACFCESFPHLCLFSPILSVWLPEAGRGTPSEQGQPAEGAHWSLRAQMCSATRPGRDCLHLASPRLPPPS